MAFTSVTFDAATHAELVAHLEGFTVNADDYDLRAMIGASDDAIAVIASEVFAALGMHGGVASARRIIDRIDLGLFNGDVIFGAGCTCFYGALATQEDDGWIEPLHVPERLRSRGHTIMADMRQMVRDNRLAHAPIAYEWSRFLTPVEALLVDSRVHRGDTADTHHGLALLKIVLQRYIALHPDQA